MCACVRAPCFQLTVRAGFIYSVSPRRPVAMEASGSCEGATVLIMRCTATPRSCDICYQPSGRETRHLFIGLIPLPIPPLSPPHTAVCVCVHCPGALCVHANPHTHTLRYVVSYSHRDLCQSAADPPWRAERDRCVKNALIGSRFEAWEY